MKCYIYFIVNKLDGKRYVGQTTNYYRRKNEHIRKLKDGKHPNYKLQQAWDRFGQDSFEFNKITYEDITKEELDKTEIYYISYYDSRENGYNIAEGGSGGDTKSKLTFEEYCISYFGNRAYSGMTNRTAKLFNVDSACIAALSKDKSYDTFREQALLLSDKEKEGYLNKFKQLTDIDNNPPWNTTEEMSDEDALRVFCVASTYGRGIEKRILTYFGKSKGFLYHAFSKDSLRVVPKDRYRKLSKEERQVEGRKWYFLWDLNQYGPQIKESYTDLFEKYKK